MSATNIGSAIEEGQNMMMEKDKCDTSRVVSISIIPSKDDLI